MKRPQGFDRARPARSAAQVPAQAPPASRPGSAAGEARAGSAKRGAARADAPRSGRGEATAPTEPIRLPVEEPAASATAAATSAAAPPGPAAAGGARETPGDERAARRSLAAAERERRRYERQEVRRFTRRSRMRRIAWLTGIGSVVGLAVLAVVVAYSPLMALREVRVEGASRIPAADIQAAFDDRIGTPLPLVSTDEVRETLSGFALIETYSTETVPPGTLVIRIVERTPVGVVEGSSGFTSVDAAGVVIDRTDERPEGLPLITVDGGLGGDAFRSVGAVLRSLPADLLARVTDVTAETPDDVRLDLVEGATVLWGSDEDSALKSTVLVRLMAAAPPDSVGRYDVSAPLSPVTQ
ncbi:FtsQ-type POTRA domain-containing protein [Agromyces aurantiacus]|uniref:FtsQ-type POTRA domain-containing protein n=1 Tax=Agromyces aurantiacus TaxID=165814 RepID=A0ABV9RAD7_9MICO|nr:FtsQ-type POTRA domain-containing protein [Agromyces aurantiacus]MBM7504602.1 cell division protein FtsQ [Agromyces aurantiacus]